MTPARKRCRARSRTASRRWSFSSWSSTVSWRDRILCGAKACGAHGDGADAGVLETEVGQELAGESRQVGCVCRRRRCRAGGLVRRQTGLHGTAAPGPAPRKPGRAGRPGAARSTDCIRPARGPQVRQNQPLRQRRNALEQFFASLEPSAVDETAVRRVGRHQRVRRPTRRSASGRSPRRSPTPCDRPAPTPTSAPWSTSPRRRASGRSSAGTPNVAARPAHRTLGDRRRRDQPRRRPVPGAPSPSGGRCCSCPRQLPPAELRKATSAAPRPGARGAVPANPSRTRSSPTKASGTAQTQKNWG